MAPTAKQLNRKQYKNDQLSRWRLLQALAAGGEKVDDEVKSKLLYTPYRIESDALQERLKTAPFVPMLGGILMKIQSQVTAKEPSYTGSDDPFWVDFFESGALSNQKDSPRCSFHRFLQSAVLQALTTQQAIAVVDTPDVGSVESLAQQRALGGDRPYVQLRPREDVWQSAADADGFKFCKLHSCRTVEDSWMDEPGIEHVFLIYEKRGGYVYFSKYKVRDESARADVDEISDKAVVEVIKEEEPVFFLNSGMSVYTKFPVVTMTFPEPLWLADQLLDTQVSLFNQTAAVEWALLSTNYAQLLFQDVDRLEELNDRISGGAGNGYYWALPPGVQATWLERDGSGIDRGREYRKELKSEMLEIVQQVASSAINYKYASGESKKEDRRALDILLEVYGYSLRRFAGDILNVAAIAHGESVAWKVDGFSNYDGDSLLEDLAQYTEVAKNINSPTLRRESQKTLSLRAIQELNLPDEIAVQIAEEIGLEPFALTDEQREFLRKLNSEGKLSDAGLFEILRTAKELPLEFDIDQELTRNGLAYAAEDTDQGETIAPTDSDRQGNDPGE